MNRLRLYGLNPPIIYSKQLVYVAQQLCYMYTTMWLTVTGTRMHTTWLNTIGTRTRVKLVQESGCSDDTWLNTIGHRPGNDDKDD